MRRLLVVTAVICGLMGLSMPMAWAYGPDTARVEGLNGQLSIQASGQAAWQNLDGSADLAAGAALKTGQQGEALVELPGNVLLRVSPNSEVRVSSLQQGEVALHLESGRMYASVPEGRDSGSALRVTTPTGEATSRGGEFTVQADAQDTALRVLSGDASLAGQSVHYAGAETVSEASVVVPAGVEAVAQNDDNQGGGDTGGGDTGGGGGGGGGGFPYFAVLGGVGLLALVIVLVSQSSEVQSN